MLYDSYDFESSDTFSEIDVRCLIKDTPFYSHPQNNRNINNNHNNHNNKSHLFHKHNHNLFLEVLKFKLILFYLNQFKFLFVFAPGGSRQG